MPTITGDAIVWGSLSHDLGGFRERIEAGAFDVSLSNPNNDIRALIEHDLSRMIGRRSANLDLKADETALRVRIDAPNTSAVRDLVENINARLVRGMSFSFSVPPKGDTWTRGNDNLPLRIVKRADLFEVSPVADPAYTATQVAARSVDSEPCDRVFFGVPATWKVVP